MRSICSDNHANLSINHIIIALPTIALSIHLYMYLPVYVSTYLTIYLSVYLIYLNHVTLCLSGGRQPFRRYRR